MLLENLEKWCQHQNPPIPMEEVNEDVFSVFYQEHSVGKGFVMMLSDLAYEVFQLQVCIEGLIEDNE